MRRLATGSAKLQRELSTAKLRMDGVRLGNVGYHRHGAMGVLFIPSMPHLRPCLWLRSPIFTVQILSVYSFIIFCL